MLHSNKGRFFNNVWDQIQKLENLFVIHLGLKGKVTPEENLFSSSAQLGWHWF